MPIISQNLFITSHSSSHTSFYFTKTHKFPNKLPLNPFVRNPFQFHLTKPNFVNVIHKHQRFSPVNSLFDPDYTVQNQRDDANVINFDAFLSVLEFVCLACSAIISIGHVVNYALLGIGKPIFGWLGDKVMTWQWAVLVSGVIVGVLIRRRQWRRICTVNFSRSGSLEQVNLVERIEKIEEDLRSSATIIRVLSRQLEKLGIRFRVTRKALKEPIAKTAELAQKNSEATRALAIQEDNLEKELSEIQKVLLAMQDQQQKQIELILAIAKSSKLLESKKEPINRQSSINATNSTMGLKPNHTETLARNKEANDEKI